MTFKEAAKRIREHRQIHQKKEPCAILISEALEMAANFFDGYCYDKCLLSFHAKEKAHQRESDRIHRPPQKGLKNHNSDLSYS